MDSHRSLSAAVVIVAIGLAGCTQVVGPGSGGVSPGPGGAFIAYVQANNVWLVTADGARSQQLTNDGATQAYANPAVAPDGTVYALRGEDTLYHFDLAGRVIGSPAQLAVLENGGEGLSVAPDGAHLAYGTTGWGGPTLIHALARTPDSSSTGARTS